MKRMILLLGALLVLLLTAQLVFAEGLFEVGEKAAVVCADGYHR